MSTRTLRKKSKIAHKMRTGTDFKTISPDKFFVTYCCSILSSLGTDLSSKVPEYQYRRYISAVLAAMKTRSGKKHVIKHTTMSTRTSQATVQEKKSKAKGTTATLPPARKPAPVPKKPSKPTAPKVSKPTAPKAVLDPVIKAAVLNVKLKKVTIRNRHGRLMEIESMK